MLERSKWQKELSVFSRLVNTVVLTGNINDQYPVIDEKKQELLGFCSLEIYLARMCQSYGYQYILCYDPVEGFHSVYGIQADLNPVEEIERLIKKAGEDAEGLRNRPFSGVTRHHNARGEVTLLPGKLENAAHLIYLLLTSASRSIAVIVSFSSRMAARPDDLDTEERLSFLYLQTGASGALKFRAGNPESPGYNKNPIIQNQLFLIADKFNDLPAWFTMTHPSLKNVAVPKPDYRMREQIIRSHAANFPGYRQAVPEEQNQFITAFVGASEGFSTKDIVRVFQIAGQNRLDIHGIDKAILLYKHGVQENPWLKMDSTVLAGAEQQIRERVIGQEPVVKAAVDIVKRAAMGMSGLQHSGSSSKPRGILFLAGPTGTGKTELAKALTKLIFLDERNMIRFDMSEYRQEQSDQRLLGAPPGYVGYEAGGQLTNAVREHPFSVLLFDEIEKAHPSILDKFLQILEDGRITDGRGETVYFQDCLIVFTSNLGITVPSPDNPAVRIPNIRYEENQSYETVREKILYGVRSYFNEELGRPELLNRIGNNILVFDYIREESLDPILQKQIRTIAGSLWAEKKIRFSVSREAMQDLHAFGAADLPKAQGGRGIGNMVEEMLINPLARYMFDNSVGEGESLLVERVLKTEQTVSLSIRREGRR